MTGRLRSLSTGIVLLILVASPGRAQDSLQQQLRTSQLRLEQIRQEREELQEAMEQLRNRVHTVNSELSNIEHQITSSADALRELDFQSAAVASSVEETTRRLLRSRDRLKERIAVLRSRLRSIYKQGPLHAVRVLLSARSFSDFLNRYKYLRLIATYDRLLVEEVRSLENNLSSQDEQLKSNLAQLQRVKEEKMAEVQELRTLEMQHQNTLEQLGERERTARSRIASLEQTASQLRDLIGGIERERKETERRRAITGQPEEEAAISTGDLGSLEWPVEGRVIYRFGPERKESGVVLRWNGIGIGASPGTPVRAVESGTVVMAGPFEGYGPSVIVSHGGGYYTSYHYLRSIRIDRDETVESGRIIGTVGGEQTPEGPHIEFQVRAPVNGQLPEPVDPLNWLRTRASQ